MIDQDLVKVVLDVHITTFEASVFQVGAVVLLNQYFETVLKYPSISVIFQLI